MKHLYKLKIIIFLLVLFTLLLIGANLALAQFTPCGGTAALISPCCGGFLYNITSPGGPVGSGMFFFLNPIPGSLVIGQGLGFTMCFIPPDCQKVAGAGIIILGSVPMGWNFGN
jgi:hypothetical protein